MSLELLCKRVLDLELLDFQDIHSLTNILKPEYKEEFLFLRPIRKGPFCGIYILQRPLKFHVTEIKTIRAKDLRPITYIDTMSHE